MKKTIGATIALSSRARRGQRAAGTAAGGRRPALSGRQSVGAADGLSRVAISWRRPRVDLRCRTGTGCAERPAELLQRLREPLVVPALHADRHLEGRHRLHPRDPRVRHRHGAEHHRPVSDGHGGARGRSEGCEAPERVGDTTSSGAATRCARSRRRSPASARRAASSATPSTPPSSARSSSSIRTFSKSRRRREQPNPATERPNDLPFVVRGVL